MNHYGVKFKDIYPKSEKPSMITKYMLELMAKLRSSKGSQAVLRENRNKLNALPPETFKVSFEAVAGNASAANEVSEAREAGAGTDIPATPQLASEAKEATPEQISAQGAGLPTIELPNKPKVIIWGAKND